MTPLRSLLKKKIWLCCLILLCALVTSSLALISLITIWIGVSHAPERAFWVPLLSGAALLSGSLWLFFAIAKAIIGHMREEEILTM